MEEKIEIKSDATDIVEHLQTLADISAKCNHITEMGVRNVVSTWAFAAGIPKGGKLVSIDIVNPDPIERLQEVIDFSKRKGFDFEFKLGDTTKMEIEETDMLFIDTIHEGPQLQKELDLHASKVRKYIVLHDTESCKRELMPVIKKFIGKDWGIRTAYSNNNGLMVLRRI